MGFTADKFPNLPSKVTARVRGVTGEVSKDTEDTAVQDILEELLSQPAPSPSAGLRRSHTTNIPGAWN